MELLDLLKNRYGIAEKFTKDFQDDAVRSIDLYKVEDSERDKLNKLSNLNSRYELKVPYIFATHESMLASMFDKVPDLVFRGRGMDDKSKEDKVRASYEYIVDKLDLENFMNETAWWFILIGWCTAHGSFKSETREVPIFDEMTGEPALDEMGQMQTRTEYIYNDPVLEVGDPKKEVFSPESKFSNDAKKIPYYFKKDLMTVEDIKKIYNEKVKPDSQIEVKGMTEDDDKENDDIDRATVYFYYGTIPEKLKKDVKDWEAGANFYVVYTNDKILHKERVDEKLCRVGKWHGVPNEFFGFGIGKTLRDYQKELSVRRGQQIRYADVMAFPKIAYDLAVEIDDKALLDPRMGVTLGYRDKPPTYLTPPPMPDTILIAEQKAREDAQFVSGMLDLSKGASESTVVKTATGQSIFAEAAERRIRQAKRQFGRFYREVIIMLLKLAQKHWDDEKMISITDSQGEQVQMSISKDDLSDVDFDTDIDVDMENVTINKEILRSQAIELYDRTKDDPLINRKMVFKDTLRDGFDKKNPEAYMVDEAELGQMPMQGDQMGQPLAQSEGGQVPSTQSGVMGAANGI
jgi:hypothetical protein